MMSQSIGTFAAPLVIDGLFALKDRVTYGRFENGLLNRWITLISGAGAVALADKMSASGVFTDGIIAIAIGTGAFLALASLREPQTRARFALLSGAFSALFVVAATFGLLQHGMLVLTAFALTQSMFVIASRLIGEIERRIGGVVACGKTCGLAEHFPQISGLFLLTSLLFACSPGSLLFIIEDLVLERIAEGGLPGLLGVMLITLLASVSSYQAYVAVFIGHDASFEHSARESTEDGLLGYRLVLAASLVIGIMPSFIG